MLGTLVRKTWLYDPTVYAPARYRRSCAYESFVPDGIADLDLSVSGETAGIVSDAESAIRELNATERGGLAPLARLLLRTESVASSKVEGMHVDARQLARAEARSETGQNVAPSAAEILANIDAMQLAVEEASGAEGVTVERIQEIHRLLLERVRPGIAGAIRCEQNWIGGNDHNPCGADFVPPPPEEVERLLGDVCRFANDDRFPPLVQAAIAHAQFETIHPFADGNGRTGRALVQVIIRRRGLAPSYVPPISVVLASDKARYIGGLVAYREGRLDEWIATFAVATARAAVLASEYLAGVRALQETWRSILRASAQVRADAAAWQLIDVLPAHPVITLPAAVALVNRTKPAVNQGIASLERAGVLVPLSEGRRNRAWEASGLLDLLAGLEDAAPPPRPPRGAVHVRGGG